MQASPIPQQDDLQSANNNNNSNSNNNNPPSLNHRATAAAAVAANSNPNNSINNSNNNHNARRVRAYRGIFKSSICDMFARRRMSKADACALACCGVWLWDRNIFEYANVRPKTFRERLPEMVIPIICLLCWYVGAKCQIPAAAGLGFLSSLVIFIIILCKFQSRRNQFRSQLAQDAYNHTTSSNNDNQNDDRGQEIQFMYVHRREITAVHSCCSCYEKDIRLGLEPAPSSNRESFSLDTPLNSDANTFHQDDDDDDDDDIRQDFIYRLCQSIANMCCAMCCNCWCLCCGICAIAQEYRFIQEIKSQENNNNNNNNTNYHWQRDYITLQSWSEYYPNIELLRRTHQYGLRAHFNALSELSNTIINCLQGLIVLVVIISCLPFLPISFWQVLVLLGTLSQPLIIFIPAYWIWNRFDISLDAVIKYFASGFVICTGMALIYEIAVQVATTIAFFVVAIVVVMIGDDLSNFAPDNSSSQYDPNQQPSIEFTNTVFFLALCYAALNSFVVAALVEEVAKYLCFWMVEHPDIDGMAIEPNRNPNHVLPEMLPSDTEAINDQETTTAATNTIETKSNVSKGSAITIAMISTALGFACAENLLYVFVYSPPGMAVEIFTLLIRSLLPVHPLCAAIQSIGICRRDLEHESKQYGVGKSILPAWLMHGSFDFVLMAMAVWMKKKEGTLFPTDDQINDPDDIDLQEEIKESLPGLVLGAAIALFFLGYYFVQANAQRRRLELMDAGNTLSLQY